MGIWYTYPKWYIVGETGQKLSKIRNKPRDTFIIKEKHRL